MIDDKKILDLVARLSGEELHALQIAALMGDTFSLDHVIDLSNIRPSHLLNRLNDLVNKRLIKENTSERVGTHCFVTRKLPDAVLRSMGDRDRKKSLSNIIGYLERELPTDDKHQLFLSELYLKVGKEEDCLQYVKKAAAIFMSAHRTEAALALYEEIIDRIVRTERGNDSTANIMLIDSVLSYAPIAINLRPPKIVLPIIERAISICKKMNDQRAQALLELCLSGAYQSQGNANASVHHSSGWRLARDVGDRHILDSASKLSALALFWQGRMREAVRVYEDYLGNREEISADVEDSWACLMLAYCYGITGQIGRSVGLAEAVKEKALSNGLLKTQAFAHSVLALVFLELRQIEKAQPHTNAALQIGKSIESDMVLWMAEPCKAYERFSKGDLAGAKKVLASGLSHAKALGQVHHPSPFVLEILWALHSEKQDPIEGYSFPSEIRRLIEWPDIYMRGAGLRFHALARKMSGAGAQEVADLLEESERFLREAGASIEWARTQSELAKLSLERGDIQQAAEAANLAYRELSEIDRTLFPSGLLPLIETSRREDRLLDGLQTISKLGGTIDLYEDHSVYLAEVASTLAEIFGAERVAIFLIGDEKKKDSLHVAAVKNLSSQELEQFGTGGLKNLILRAIEQQKSLTTGSPEASMNFPHQAWNGPVTKSFACSPLTVSGKVIGLIYMDNLLFERLFAEEDSAILNVIASQVALFVNNAKLCKQLKNQLPTRYDGDTHLAPIKFHRDFPKIVGKSTALRSALSRVRKVASTDATVLIRGETGVGKELFAEAIHQHSDRADRPFIAVNVAALTESLLTSELFGYEKGAFTGAGKGSMGRFELAHGGTILLDEIGELSIEAQVKLLRVLQDGGFERVGGTQTIRSDFRLIVATNRNLQEMIANGKFRSELFYRISIFPIDIPPLRQRKEDTADLVLHFVEKYSSRHGRKIESIPDTQMEKLLAYSWPGNIRELEHVIEGAVILSEKGVLLIPDFQRLQAAALPEAPSHQELLPLDEIERRHIENVLNHVKWRIRGNRGAAEILGLKPSTLEFRMKKLGLTRVSPE